ncbi:unnamed protein product [Phytophthora fragariaefolia]|uniref:Unnamed protein product n=1 Tax=Phytophthora fragariaefolia TaxID=1490495 RepID=A0A9W6XZ86_9STRA|nr:unnamed protein product [Phytophthora fragariaefolia]
MLVVVAINRSRATLPSLLTATAATARTSSHGLRVLHGCVGSSPWLALVAVTDLVCLCVLLSPSTENWKREKAEIDALMKLVDGFIHDILGEALTHNIRVRVLASDSSKLPAFLVNSIKEVETKTQHCNAFHLNLCVSYGARDEIVGACKKIAAEVADGKTNIDDIDEDLLSQRMLTAYVLMNALSRSIVLGVCGHLCCFGILCSGLPDPDIMLRTSGELRISNFLLYQIAYAELIFMDKFWPEVTRDDLQDIIVEFNRRKRRFGK